jgi:uncharacterized protein YutE (UPF0331/DUF86 family)
VTDLGNHVIAELELGAVDAYRDIPTLLRTAGYIDGEPAERWMRMIGFRNILVHEYLTIDREIVYDVLQNRLGDLREIRQAFALFL